MLALRVRYSHQNGTFRWLSPTRSWCAYGNRAITMFPEGLGFCIEEQALRGLSFFAETNVEGHTHHAAFNKSFEGPRASFRAKGNPYFGEAHFLRIGEQGTGLRP